MKSIFGFLLAAMVVVMLISIGFWILSLIIKAIIAIWKTILGIK